MTEDRAALVGRLRHLSVAIGAPIEARRTRKDEERWSAELADIAAALAMQPPGDGELAALGTYIRLRSHSYRDEDKAAMLEFAERVDELAAKLVAQDREMASWRVIAGDIVNESRKAEQRAEAAMGLLRAVRPALACEDTYHPCSDLRRRIDRFIAGGAAEKSP